MKITFILFLLSIILFPFYMFSSGVPQPSHLLFFVSGISALILLRQSSQVMSGKCCNSLLLFVFYVMLVNVLNSLIYATKGDGDIDQNIRVVTFASNLEPLTYALFYLFNYCVFAGLICMGAYFSAESKLNTFWSGIFFAVLVCILIQAVMGYANLGRQFKNSYRGVLFFNNPNQLGYFSVAATALLFIAHRQTQLPKILLVFGFVGALYISSLALSKAAIISVILFPFIYVMAGRDNISQRIVVMFMGGLLIMVAINFVDDSVLTNIQVRMSGIGSQADDSFVGRAYDRITLFPEYLFFGAGEGLRAARFDRGVEIHSLFATLLFSYGLVGCALFINFLWHLLVRVGVRDMAYLLPLAAYNLTHNGWRSPLLWIVFALLVVEAATRQQRQPAEDRKQSRDKVLVSQ